MFVCVYVCMWCVYMHECVCVYVVRCVCVCMYECLNVCAWCGECVHLYRLAVCCMPVFLFVRCMSVYARIALFNVQHTLTH